MSGLLALGAGLAAAAVVAAGCGGDSRTEAGASAEQSLLFVHTARSGSLDTRKGVLELDGASPSVLFFSDRPRRIAGHTALRSFADQWPDLFGDDPPNAAVQHLGAAERAYPQIVELLRAPRTRRGSVTYSVRLIDPPADPPGRVRMREVSVFIDAGLADPKSLESGSIGARCTPFDPRCDTSADVGDRCTITDPRCGERATGRRE